MEKKNYSLVFYNSLDYRIEDYCDSVDIKDDNQNERISEIDENYMDSFLNKENCESSIIINENSFICKEVEMINDTSFIYNDDKNDYLNLLGMMDSSFSQPFPLKTSKDIFNNNISKKTRESSNLTGNNYKNFTQSFQNSTIKDKTFKYNDDSKYNNKKIINQNKSFKIEENKQLNESKYVNINNKTLIQHHKFIPLNQNEDYNNIFNNNKENSKYDFSSFSGNSKKTFNPNSQISFTELQNYNGIFFQYNRPKLDFSKISNSFIYNKDKSYTSIECNNQSIGQNKFIFPFRSKDNNSINSFYSNKKRKRSPNNYINESEMNMDHLYFSYIIDKSTNKFDFSLSQKDNKNKSLLFKIKKKKNFGRKKIFSGEIGKHKKSDPDNMRKKVKTLTFQFISDIINNELKRINMKDINKSFCPVKLLQINQQQASNSTKIYNLDLLNKSFKSIFSVPISGRSNNDQNHNRDLINKLYEIYGSGNLENLKKTEKIIKFMDMKFKDFFYYVKRIMDSPNFIENKGGDNEQVEGIIREFISKLDKYFNENDEEKVYNQKLKENIKNYPSVINNMKESKK